MATVVGTVVLGSIVGGTEVVVSHSIGHRHGLHIHQIIHGLHLHGQPPLLRANKKKICNEDTESTIAILSRVQQGFVVLPKINFYRLHTMSLHSESTLKPIEFRGVTY